MALRAFYSCYYLAVGTSVPYFSPYLKQLGLSGRAIALMLSVAPFLHLGAPLVWGWAADRTRRPDLLLRLACGGALAFVAPLVFVRTMPALLVLYTLHQSFTIAIGGLADSLTLEHVRREGGDYTRIRLFGSLSFAAVAIVVGRALDHRNVTGGDALVPLVMSCGFALAFLMSFTVGGRAERERPHAADVRALLTDERFLFLVVVAPLHWAALAPYHGFFGILLHDRGLSDQVVGAAWMTSVCGEIAALWLFRHLRRHASLMSLFALTFGASAVRWALTATATSAAVLIATQTLHALSFGVFWATALSWLSTCVPPRLRATGQLLFTGATYGLGNILGMLGTGQIYDRLGGAPPAYAAAAAIALVPLVLTLGWGRRLAPAA